MISPAVVISSHTMILACSKWTRSLQCDHGAPLAIYQTQGPITPPMTLLAGSGWIEWHGPEIQIEMPANRETTPPYLSRYGPPHRALERRVISTGEPGLRLRFYPGVETELRNFLKSFAGWLRGVIEFRHPVHITIVSQGTVMGFDGAPGWAVFLIPSPEYTNGDLVRIYVAGGKLWALERDYGFTREVALLRVAEDMAHEIVHYEQWRDRREISERGVNRRAESLVRRFLAGIG